MKKITLIALITLCSTQVFADSYVSSELKDSLYQQVRKNHVDLSYDDARKIILGGIYLEQDSSGRVYLDDLYCGKRFYSPHVKRGMIPENRVLNVEHVWPQSKFNRQIAKSVQKTDLHHLLPVASLANSKRGNFDFTNLPNGSELYSECYGSLYNGKEHLFEPPNEIKGEIARSMFYFSIRYRVAIDPAQEAVLREWHEQDPVSDREREMHELKAKKQKNRNPFIDDQTLVNLIVDF